NENCTYAQKINKFLPEVGLVTGYFHNYYGSDLNLDTAPDSEKIDSLRDMDHESDVSGTLGEGQFTDRIHKGALWFKKEFDVSNKFVIHVTPQNRPADQDQISQAFL